MPSRTHTAVYPGTFDPPTFGHLDVIKRGRSLFDRVVVGVGHNPEKRTVFTIEERAEMLTELVVEMTDAEPELADVEVSIFEGLTVDFARRAGASALLRGIRNLSDVQNEIQQAVTNREVAQLETAFVVAGSTYAYTSSTLIRQVTAMGSDLHVLDAFVPPSVIARLQAKKADDPDAFTPWRGGG
ncbi:MAG: pantetheine-phosphate adenylyltransferase [Planctomycetota bacterium]